MNFWRRFLIFILTIALIVLSICLVLLDTLGSGIKINQFVKKLGLYQTSKNSFLDRFDQTITLPSDVDKAKLKSSIDKAISTADIEKTFEPALVDLAVWLNLPKNVPEPKLIIDLSQLKDKLEAGIEQDFSSTQKDQIIFGLTSQVSDRVVITFEKGDAGDNTLSADSIKQIKNLYLAAKSIFWILIATIATIFILLVLTNVRKGRRMLQKPAWGFFNAGVSILVISYVLPFFLLTPTPNQANIDQLPVNISRVVLIELRFWGYVWLVIWLALIVCSLALKKPARR